MPLTSLRHADVRERIIVSDTGAALFAGRLADRIDERGNGDVEKALFTASAEDILEALPDGLDSIVTEKGRSFSGGQRQRLVLARALAADPEIPVPGRADQRRRRPHRGADRVPAAGPPRGSHHGRHDGQSAPARRRRRGGVPRRRAGRRGGHPRLLAGRRCGIPQCRRA
ncbi:ATP-binding cassette domain-containing protein [Nocardioides sp. B-3]|uniref:ATP-binding cassette domain-containing protein n=1 Tax=Nocardioides sp. B-3 TaxID=2895565 RepID=UPI0021530647|nr:ATP-binding cassette domain-containing protein [Nocardioides sp. B-3]UUZ57965.1 ATP-binding cassette domain-containing protein [Nocardioides sp. B-3]